MSNQDDLYLKWELGLTTTQEEALLTTVLADPKARRDFVRYARIAASLSAATPQPVMIPLIPAIDSPTSQFTKTRPSTKRIRRQNKTLTRRTTFPPASAMAAGILICIGITVLVFTTLSKPSPTDDAFAQLTANGNAII
jgi:hypothetical protein